MMTFELPDIKNQFQSAFNVDFDTITPAQMMWLVKFAKHIRGRCRNNSALKNYLMRNFKHLQFQEVPAEWHGRRYDKLVITDKAGTTAEAGDEE